MEAGLKNDLTGVKPELKSNTKLKVIDIKKTDRRVEKVWADIIFPFPKVVPCLFRDYLFF
jgi:hypothetical protein